MCTSHKSPIFPRQELISRVPKGEEMTRKLSSLLADNSAKFGYSDAVVKSLKMELHAVAERIRYTMFKSVQSCTIVLTLHLPRLTSYIRISCSCLKAGLKTWKDHLERITALEADRLSETEAVEAELEAVARSAAACEEDVATHKEMRRQLELCKVGPANTEELVVLQKGVEILGLFISSN